MRRSPIIENGSTYISPACQPPGRTDGPIPIPPERQPSGHPFDHEAHEAHAADCRRTDAVLDRIGITLIVAAGIAWVVLEIGGLLS